MPSDADLKMMVDDQAHSAWFRKALLSALECDPVDAANDAGLLSIVLDKRVTELAAAVAAKAMIKETSREQGI